MSSKLQARFVWLFDKMTINPAATAYLIGAIHIHSQASVPRHGLFGLVYNGGHANSNGYSRPEANL